MLNKLRNFSKSKLAAVLVGIIIIPFVFWGMGGVFQGGNTNNIAKIGNHSVSSKEFINHINSIGISSDIIKKNLDKNILNEILNDLLAKKFIELEIRKHGLKINEKNLVNLIKNNKNFLDEDNKFKRIKYEKFLIENNITASQFEMRLKKRQLEKMLFNYYGGGINIPGFLINALNDSENSPVTVEYINLEEFYKKKEDFNLDEIKDYINKNKNKLKINYVDFNYAKLTPQNLVNSSEFNDDYFKKIDIIENSMTKFSSLSKLLNEFSDIKIKEINDYTQSDKNNEFNFIFNYLEDNNIQIIDKNDYFLIFKVIKFENKVPDLSTNFQKEIKEILFKEEKYNYNKKIYDNIQLGKFENNNFKELTSEKNKYKKVVVKSIRDNKIFNSDSLELLYSLPVKSFTFLVDEKENVYLGKILKIGKNTVNKKEYNKLSNKVSDNIAEEIYSSYDLYLNGEYNVEINYNALERVNNFFR